MPPFFNTLTIPSMVSLIVLYIFQIIVLCVSLLEIRLAMRAISVGIDNYDFSRIGVIVSCGVVLAIIKLVEGMVREYLGQKYIGMVREALYTKLYQLPKSETERRRIGALSLRFLGDMQAIKYWVSFCIPKICSNFITFPILGGLLYWIQPDIAVMIFINLACCALLFSVGITLFSKYYQKQRSLKSRLSINIIEKLRFINELYSINYIKKDLKNLKYQNDDVIRSSTKQAGLRGLFRLIIDFASLSSFVFILLYALKNHLTLDEITLSIILSSTVFIELRHISRICDGRLSWNIALNRLLILFSLPSLPCGKIRKLSEKRNLSISFIFPNEKITIGGSSVFNFFGPSGCGKSLIVGCASGMAISNKLDVLVKERVVLDLSPKLRNKMIFRLALHLPILKGSLRKALTLGIQPRPSDVEIIQAIKELGCIELSSFTLERSVFEQGKNLSSGIVKDIYLVRAVLAKPDILLIDDFECFDSEKIQLVTNNFRLQKIVIIFSKNKVDFADQHFGLISYKEVLNEA
ncbi:ABC transporter transmembrane domain-containing protein [Photobacterium damselae]|uniref:ABC transporter transmembrane domain-containing protein n=1 Tax=Photobacterium damselae TaxID=38293 RepID=UPI0040690EDD